MGQKKGKWEAKKEEFVVKILGKLFNLALGRLSRSATEEYTPLVINLLTSHIAQVMSPDEVTIWLSSKNRQQDKYLRQNNS